jgi:hypothetical protein
MHCAEGAIAMREIDRKSRRAVQISIRRISLTGAIDLDQGDASCTPYDRLAAVKPPECCRVVGCCGSL